MVKEMDKYTTNFKEPHQFNIIGTLLPVQASTSSTTPSTIKTDFV